MNKFHLQIATPDGVFFDGDAESLLVHTSEGDTEILAGHMDYVASLGTGRARIRTQTGDRLAAVSGGLVTVAGGEVKLVAVTFEYAEDIDPERARASKETAEKKIVAAKDDAALRAAEAKLLRALCRIKVAESI